jgi:hypothetical protein
MHETATVLLFLFTGELKQKADGESLQASWAPIDEILQRNSKRFPLR